MPPPSTSRHRAPLAVFTHPFELALGFALIIAGARGIIGGDVTPSLDALPNAPFLMYLAVSTLGGIGVVTGVLMSDPAGHPGLGLSIERAALYLVAASYLGLAFLILGNNAGRGAATALVYLVIGGACILRTVAIRRAALVMLAQVRQQLTNEDEAR